MTTYTAAIFMNISIFMNIDFKHLISNIYSLLAFNTELPPPSKWLRSRQETSCIRRILASLSHDSQMLPHYVEMIIERRL